MAQITKRGDRWQARVRKSGISESATFPRKTEAAAWAAQMEADITAGRLGRAADRSFGDLLVKFRDEVLERRDGARWERIRIDALLGGKDRPADKLVPIRLPLLGPEHFAAWRDRRLAVVSAATVRREWNLLSAICTKAVDEWRWLPKHPMKGVERPEAPPPRTRRIAPDEIERILHACGYRREVAPETLQARAGVVFLFALETAMRAGEICALGWADVDVDRRVAHVRAVMRGARKTGTGSARTVPLSGEAIRLIEQARGLDGERVFALDTSQLDSLFRKAKARAMVDGLHFHDTRAEALTRLSKKLDVMQLARVSGHKDLRILHSTYYRETAEDMARMLD